MYIWPILEEVVFTIKLASRQTKRRTCVTQQHGELVINTLDLSQAVVISHYPTKMASQAQITRTVGFSCAIDVSVKLQFQMHQ